jgi:uncharacterized protein
MNPPDLAKKLAASISRRPWVILGLSAVLVTAALFAAGRLRLATDIADMLPPDNESGRSYISITEQFATTSSLVVAVENPDRVNLLASAEDFAARMKSDPAISPLVRNVRLSMDRAFLVNWGLMLSNTEELRDQERILEKTNLLPFFRSINELMESKLASGEETIDGGDEEQALVAQMAGLELLARDLAKAIATGGDSVAEDSAAGLVDNALFGDRYMTDAVGTTLLMIVTPSFDLGDRKKLTALTEAAYKTASSLSGLYPQSSFRFAGEVSGEADEEKSLGADSFYPSIAALAVIFVLFLFSFKRLRAVLFALVTLAVGIIIDLGFASIAIGELNMITSSFGVLLVGLGIDFGIHLATRFDEATASGLRPDAAISDSFGRVFVPVSIGALTTAAAFYSLLLSRSPAFQQFGLIAGTGIISCLIATFTVLPALLTAFPGKPRTLRSRPRPMIPYHSLAGTVGFFARKRVATIAVGAILAAVAIALLPGNRFEYDFRAIGPRDTATKRTENMINERFRISTYTSLVSVDSLEEARSLASLVEAAPFVKRTESLADYLPEAAEQEARLAIINRIGQASGRAGTPVWNESKAQEFADEIQRLEWNLIEFADLAAASLGENCLPIMKRDSMIREIRGADTGSPGKEVFLTLIDGLEAASGTPDGLARLSAIDRAFAREMDRRISAMTSIGRRMTEDDIPTDILNDLRSPDGRHYLVSINPSPDLRGDEALMRYAEGLTAIDGRITGGLQLGLEFSKVTLEESKKAGLIVAAIVIILSFLGFRSIRLTLAVTLNLALGILIVFSVYPFLGKFNIVSILALPLILGMGIDYGVHVATSWQREHGLRGIERIEAAFADSSKAVSLSALTTFIGFGSLALVASFKGIMDLGIILSLGILACFIPTFTLLPALLAVGMNNKGSTGLEIEEIKEVS